MQNAVKAAMIFFKMGLSILLIECKVDFPQVNTMFLLSATEFVAEPEKIPAYYMQAVHIADLVAREYGKQNTENPQGDNEYQKWLKEG